MKQQKILLAAILRDLSSASERVRVAVQLIHKLPNKEFFQRAKQWIYFVLLPLYYSKLYAPWNDKLLTVTNN